MNPKPSAWSTRSLILVSAAYYFGIVFGVGFLLGAIRVPFLVPRIGERLAELAEMPLMFIAIFFAAGYIVKKHGSFVSSGGWAVIGAIALGLLVCAELILAAVFAGRGVAEYIAGRDPVSGTVYLGMLVVFAAMPWLRRGLADSHSQGPSNGSG
jgi:hypothetical protein